MKHGDFSGLAENYSKFRPSYSDSVVRMLLSLVDKPMKEIDFADIGAGTGIWTRKVASYGLKSSMAVEPNDDMRSHGVNDSSGTNIRWAGGSGEHTGLDNDSVDLLTMASSFHWVDFEAGIEEFARVIRSGGRFAAVWNPRCVEANPFTKKIEDYLHSHIPGMKRVSSGNSEFTDILSGRLAAHPLLEDVTYMEGFHVQKQSPSEYLGVWKSVNDIRVQAGEEKFADFISFIERELRNVSIVEAHYKTRAWTARIK